MKRQVLTDAAARAAKPREAVYQLPDGTVRGLALRITPAGHRAWTLRYRTADGLRRRMDLGDFPAVSVTRARKKANAIVGKVADGNDPAAERHARRSSAKPISDLVDVYLEDAEVRLRSRTMLNYKAACGLFTEWCRKKHVRVPAELNRARLSEFRSHLIKLQADEVQSAHTTNQRLRAVVSMLNALRRDGLLPLDRDALADTLARVQAPVDRPVCLRPSKLRKLLGACARHDAAKYEETRAEHAGKREPGTTPKHRPISAFVAVALLTGMRRGELLGLRWADVDLDEREIVVSAAASKTHRGRVVDLSVSPGIVKILAAMKLRAGAEDRVFPGHTPTTLNDAVGRLVEDYGAPAFTLKALRSTCSSYLASAPSIFGAASVFKAASQLGHSVDVAQRHYLSTLRIAKDADVLDSAMKIEPELAAIVERVGTGLAVAV